MDVSRENTVNPSAVTPDGLRGHLTPAKAWKGEDSLPFPDDADYLRRWDATTRFHLLYTELVSGLEFQSSADGTGKVLCRSAEGKQELLVSMRRPKRAVFDAQLAMVLERLRERADRTPEILTQVVPQYAYWSAIANLHPARTPWTIELTQAALHFSMLVCQRLKHILACPRPVEYSPLVQPIVLTPTYAALPSGHATEAYMFAKMMKAILSQCEDVSPVADVVNQLSLIAKRISDNRIVAGLHFPVDGSSGYVLADALAAYVEALGSGGQLSPRYFNGSEYSSFDAKQTPLLVTDPAYFLEKAQKKVARTKEKKFNVPQSEIVAYMFEQARAEVEYGRPRPSKAPVNHSDHPA